MFHIAGNLNLNLLKTPMGMKLFSLTFSNGFSQLINEPTHMQTNSTSCIDLIFTDQESLTVNSGVHSSLHPNRHHQIVHSSFNPNIYSPPPIVSTISMGLQKG